MTGSSTLQWQCQWDQLPAQITVGTVLHLSCQGDTATLDKARLQFSGIQKDSPYALILRQVEQWDPHSARLAVVSYVPGEHHLSGLNLTDGQHQIIIPQLDYTVASVLKKNAQTKPFGPYGPFTLSIPLYFWLLLGALILLLIGLVGMRIRRTLERKRWVKDIRAQVGPQGAYSQFSKTMRQLARTYSWEKGSQDVPEDFVKNLNESFRTYLAQELLIPIQVWTSRTALREVRKRERILYRQQKAALEGCLKELDRALAMAKPLAPADCQQLFELCRRCAEQVWKFCYERGQRRRRWT